MRPPTHVFYGGIILVLMVLLAGCIGMNASTNTTGTSLPEDNAAKQTLTVSPPAGSHFESNESVIEIVSATSGTTKATGIVSSTPVTTVPVTANNTITKNQVITLSAGTSIAFNESDNGKVYSIPLNTEFSINLIETRASNLHWEPSLSPGLQLIDDHYYANPKSIRFDIDGTRTWRIRATGSGKQSFSAATEWYSKEDPRSRYNLSFLVR
jgi:predicted secreted protein